MHNGYTRGSTLIAYGNNSSYMSSDGMSGTDAYWAGYYQQERAKDLNDYQVAQGYSLQGRATAGDYEPGWESASITKRLVDGANAFGWVLNYNFGSADGCPYTFSGQDGQTCAAGGYTWPLGDVGYVSYSGATVPLPEIYYSIPDQAAQWTAIRKWWNHFVGGFNFFGVTGEHPAQITPGRGFARLSSKNPGLVLPELVCFGC